MADNETVAAILVAGMLPTTLPPAKDCDGGIDNGEQARLVGSVLHAVGLYRSVLEALALPAKTPSRSANSATNGQPELRLVANRPEPIAQVANHERLRPQPPAASAIEPDSD